MGTFRSDILAELATGLPVVIDSAIARVSITISPVHTPEMAIVLRCHPTNQFVARKAYALAI
jgi:hypothetical protein